LQLLKGDMEKPVISSEQMDELCFASYQLLQVMGNIYGSDPADEMFKKLEEVLGHEVKSNLFLKMLESSYVGSGPMHFRFDHRGCANAITMIKAVREFGVDKSHNKYSLKDAKDLIDLSRQSRATTYFLDQASRKAFLEILKANNGQTL
jgi:hypothetical protein